MLQAGPIQCSCHAGSTVRLPITDDPLEDAQLLAIAELGGSGRGDTNDRIYLAAALTYEAVERYLKDIVQVRFGLVQTATLYLGGSKPVTQV